MKLLFLLLPIFTCGLAGQGQVPGYVQSIEHKAVHLDTMDGRKLLIVILPAQPDTGLLGQLIRFQGKYRMKVRTIGIVAPGSVALATALSQNGYSNLSAAGMMLTEGVADADSVAGPRSGILKYLSRKSRNRQVDRFAEGSKYFLSEKGRMFAQLGKTGSLDSQLADHLVQTIVPGESRY